MLGGDCDKVVEYFKEKKIDALFVINCNFSMENAAFSGGEIVRSTEGVSQSLLLYFSEI